MRSHKLTLALAASVSLLGSGCTSIGPHTIARDRFQYGDAVGTSWKNQTLLNMVKLRYSDMPVFLDVSSVISQYGIEGQISVATPGYESPNTIFPIASGSARYIEKPTISYVPVTGEKFTKSLLTPIPPASVVGMVQAGWPVDMVFQVCVSAINGLNNDSSARATAREEDPRFRQMLQALRRVQLSGAVGMRVQKRNEGDSTVMFFREKADEAVLADVKLVRSLLGLDPEAKEFNITFGAVAEGNKQIAILSRSMIEIMLQLGTGVEVPASDIAEHRTHEIAFKAANAGDEFRAQIPVHCTDGMHRPANAFVAVRYRDHWFWIDDRDYKSKRLFLFLMFLFSMAETGVQQGAPVLTIPAG